MILEIKPEAQTIVPAKPKRVTKRYIETVITYRINQAKFAAATARCEGRGYKFQVITERDLFPDKQIAPKRS